MYNRFMGEKVKLKKYHLWASRTNIKAKAVCAT